MSLIRVPTEKEWEILMEYLQEPVVLISPILAERLKEKDDQELDGLDLPDYNFGGESDIVVDIVTSESHFAMTEILKELERQNDDVAE